MYQIEINNRRCIEYENDNPKFVWEQYLELTRRFPDSEIAILKDGDLMMVKGMKRVWTGNRLPSRKSSEI